MVPRESQPNKKKIVFHFRNVFFFRVVYHLSIPPPPQFFRSLGDEEIIHVTKYVQGIVHTPFRCRTSFPPSLAHLKSQWIYVKKTYKNPGPV